MQYLSGIGLQGGAGHRKHRTVLLVDDLYPQSLAGDIQQQLLFELSQRGISFDGLFDFFLQ